VYNIVPLFSALFAVDVHLRDQCDEPHRFLHVAGFFGGFDLCPKSGEFRLRVL
jgi:hypothetical protein